MQDMPFRCLLVGMADLAQEKFFKWMSDELERQGQTVLIESTRRREGWSAIEIKRDGESLHGRVIVIHVTI